MLQRVSRCAMQGGCLDGGPDTVLLPPAPWSSLLSGALVGPLSHSLRQRTEVASWQPAGIPSPPDTALFPSADTGQGCVCVYVFKLT